MQLKPFLESKKGNISCTSLGLMRLLFKLTISIGICTFQAALGSNLSCHSLFSSHQKSLRQANEQFNENLRLKKDQLINFLSSPQVLQLIKFKEKPTQIIHPVARTQSKLAQIEKNDDGSYRVKVSSNSLLRSVHEITYEYPDHYVEIIKPLNDERSSSTMVNFKSTEEAKSYIESQNLHEHETYLVGNGQQTLALRILESLNFVIDQYKERKQWPNEFLRELVKTAFQYAYHSTYITVRAKNNDGSKGQILGTGRLIAAPYTSISSAKLNRGVDNNFVAAKFATQNEMGQFGKNWKLDFQKLKNSGLIRDEFKQDLWRDVFDSQFLHLTAKDLQIPPAVQSGDLHFVPTPMESILNHYLPEQRRANIYDVGYYVEPGNFAILPDRMLPESLRKHGASTIYFHFARLIRSNAGANGPTTKVGTYAGDHSSSDTYYKFLGFELSDQVAPQNGNTPTNEKWNILTGNGDVLKTALQKRMGFSKQGDLEAVFSIFDGPESGFIFEQHQGTLKRLNK